MTYLALNALVLSFVLATANGLLGQVRRRGRTMRVVHAAMTLTAVALIVLTIVFDSLMIAADLFRYDQAKLVGLRVWLAPVEDLAWPLGAAVGLPALWEALDRGRAASNPASTSGTGTVPERMP